MPIKTYDDLIDAIVDTLVDADLVAKAPRFVMLAEARFNRILFPLGEKVEIPALSASNQTNWLLAAHPDLYLYAALVHAEFHGWNDERLPLIKSGVDEMVAEIQAADAIRRRAVVEDKS